MRSHFCSSIDPLLAREVVTWDDGTLAQRPQGISWDTAGRAPPEYGLMRPHSRESIELPCPCGSHMDDSILTPRPRGIPWALYICHNHCLPSDLNPHPTTMTPHFYPAQHSRFSAPSDNDSTPTPWQPRLVNDSDVVVLVFHFYRLDYIHGANWNLERWWHRLTHVCRTWRQLIFSHPSYLDLHLVCTYGTPIIDMLTLSPPFQLIINYPNQKAEITAEDIDGLLFTLRHCKRVRRISLTTSTTKSRRILAAMDGDFPVLKHLRITSSMNDDPTLTLPTTFRTPNLSSLTLIGPIHPIGAPLSPTTIRAISLVELIIRDIPPSPDFHPEYFVTQLSSMPLLVTISLGFSSPIPNRIIEKQLLNLSTTSITLHRLTRFRFWGVSAFLEGLLARINAPILRKFGITLFNQLTFSLPCLSHFIGTTPRLKLPIARADFHKHNMSITVDNNGSHQDHGFFRISVACQYLGWQVDAAAQICNAIAPVLSAAQELTLSFRKHRPLLEHQDEVIPTKWHNLLRPFTNVTILRVHPRRPVGEFSHALQLNDNGESLRDVLPQLCEFVLPSHTDWNKAFFAFLNAHRAADRPRGLHLPGLLPTDKRPSRSINHTNLKMTSTSPMRNTNHASRNSSVPPVTRVEGQHRLIPEHNESSTYTGPEGRTESRQSDHFPRYRSVVHKASDDASTSSTSDSG